MDTETTGLDPASNGMIQVAGIVEIDGDVKEEFNFKCKPVKGDFVTKKALEVNGISLDDLRGWPEPREVYYKFKSVLDKYVDKYDKKDKFYAIGQNIGFDLDFIRLWFVKHGDAYFGSYIHYHKVDIIAVTTVMKIAGRLNIDNMKLETVMKALSMGDQTHDALDDVRATRKIFYTYVSWIKTLDS